jgi:hypothetical protein
MTLREVLSDIAWAVAISAAISAVIVVLSLGTPQAPAPQQVYVPSVFSPVPQPHHQARARMVIPQFLPETPRGQGGRP